MFSFQVNVKIDYVKPPSDGFPERTCATVTISGVNVAEALISKGFATVLRHRQDDDQRSSCYDELLSAETRAAKNAKGLHSKNDRPIHRVADLSGVSKRLPPGFTSSILQSVLFNTHHYVTKQISPQMENGYLLFPNGRMSGDCL